jgi:hypothetical protein
MAGIVGVGRGPGSPAGRGNEIKEQIMTSRQNLNEPRPLRPTKTADLSDGAATANNPGGTELGDDMLDHVAGGQLPKPPPEPPDPCIK